MAGTLIGWIWDIKELSSTQQHILLALNERIAWNDFTHRWECHPSYNYIAKMTRRHRSTVLRSINEMVAFGILTIEHTHDHTGRQRNNFFILNAPPLVSDMFKTGKPEAAEPVTVAPRNPRVAQCDPHMENQQNAPLQASPSVPVAQCDPPVAECDPHEGQGLEGQTAQDLAETGQVPERGGSTAPPPGVAQCDPIPLVVLPSTSSTATSPAREEFAMFADWQPGPDFAGQANLQGVVPQMITPDLIGEFKSYWLARPERRHTDSLWKHKLAQALKRAQSKGLQQESQTSGNGVSHGARQRVSNQDHKREIFAAIVGGDW